MAGKEKHKRVSEIRFTSFRERALGWEEWEAKAKGASGNTGKRGTCVPAQADQSALGRTVVLFSLRFDFWDTFIL